MNEMKIFNNTEFGEIGVLVIDGKEYFPATECAKVLEYANPHKAIINHCRWVTKREVPHPQNTGKTIEKNFITEGDLYRLILGASSQSKNPKVKKRQIGLNVGSLMKYCLISENMGCIWQINF